MEDVQQHRRISETRIVSESFVPQNVDELIGKLKEFGIWDQTIAGEDGTEILWTENKAKKLFRDFEKGEREFHIARYKSDSGDERERFETSMNSVRANIYYVKPGEILNLVQSVAQKTQTKDADGMISSAVVIKDKSRRDSSVSGKVPSSMKDNPLAVLHQEMREELRLSTDDYKIIKTSGPKKEENMSLGYPGLWTRFEYIEYDIVLHESGYIERGYDEISEPIETNNLVTTQINMFRWVRIAEPEVLKETY